MTSLRREMSFNNRRDCWRLAHNGVEIDRPLSLELAEQAIRWDSQGAFRIRHADEKDVPVGAWQEVVLRDNIRLPSKGHTSFYRRAEPPTPQETQDAPGDTWQRRLGACEDHQSAMVDSIQRVQKQMSTIGTQNGSLVEELRAIREQLSELSDQVCRNQYDIAGIRMEVVGAA